MDFSTSNGPSSGKACPNCATWRDAKLSGDGSMFVSPCPTTCPVCKVVCGSRATAGITDCMTSLRCKCIELAETNRELERTEYSIKALQAYLDKLRQRKRRLEAELWYEQ